MKSTTTITIDTEVLIMAREKYLNISKFCNEALKEYLNVKNNEKKDIDEEIKKVSIQLAKLREMKEAKEKKEKEDKKKEEFEILKETLGEEEARRLGYGN